MRKVYLRVQNYKDIEISSNARIFPIDECREIHNRFCTENKLTSTFIKSSYTFDGDVLIHCRLHIEDLRDLKIKSIII